MEHIFCCNCLGADARIGECEVFWDVFVEMVADHEHLLDENQDVGGLVQGAQDLRRGVRRGCWWRRGGWDL